MGSSKSHSANLLGSSLGMCYGCMCGHVKLRQKISLNLCQIYKMKFTHVSVDSL